MTTVDILNISKTFTNPSEPSVAVLESLQLTLSSGKFVALVGPNGCGKTTLLNIIAGIIDADNGTININGINTTRPSVGYVWQNYSDSLLPWLTIRDNIALPVRAKLNSWDQGRSDASALLSEFLPELNELAKPYELSGGQQQLVSVLRAVASKPDILLLDEPFSALDQHRSWHTALFLERIWSERRIPILLVSHDIDEAVLLADEIVFLSKKKMNISKTVTNSLPRPRRLSALTDPVHVECRNELIQCLQNEGTNDGERNLQC